MSGSSGGDSVSPNKDDKQCNAEIASGNRFSKSVSKFFPRRPDDSLGDKGCSEEANNHRSKRKLAKWSLGILNDTETDEVPGSVLLMSKESNRNEPLGLQNAPARTSASSIPSPYPSRREKKRTADGKIILEPQPDDSLNDPLNWPAWRRDAALLSLGFYCMLGGGMTPILAAGFHDVAETYDVPVTQIALTTGLYMMGLGVGSVVFSPTAILYGKRPTYLLTAVIFLLTAAWCALSPTYNSLLVARIFQGLAVSPVECLPSATVAEIFFLHERAYRLGIYTLLLLGGKNLVPLVSAAIIQSLGWPWVFWIVAITVGFCTVLLFLFVPETFWDRTPRPHRLLKRQRELLTRSRSSLTHPVPRIDKSHSAAVDERCCSQAVTPQLTRKPVIDSHHVEFVDQGIASTDLQKSIGTGSGDEKPLGLLSITVERKEKPTEISQSDNAQPSAAQNNNLGLSEKLDEEERLDSRAPRVAEDVEAATGAPQRANSSTNHDSPSFQYTAHYRSAPPKSFIQTLQPYSGRLSNDNWFRAAFRPFILFLYPAVLWSALVYSLSVGWLIVLSESVSEIYRDRELYNFTALQTGLVYLSPFIGGVLGTAVAGKVSDVIVRFMSRRNDGVYEPEFRLVMAIPVAVSTTIGLMGFGWSAEERNAWIVPTLFFGIISFGCSLGSTTAITFCVDSYRQYAGEALVTLNFSKNVFHGLIFSLFFPDWLHSAGAKEVFIVIGGIQMASLLLTIPMYIYGKRARMWTVRRNLMENV